MNELHHLRALIGSFDRKFRFQLLGTGVFALTAGFCGSSILTAEENSSNPVAAFYQSISSELEHFSFSALTEKPSEFRVIAESREEYEAAQSQSIVPVEAPRPVMAQPSERAESEEFNVASSKFDGEAVL